MGEKERLWKTQRAGKTVRSCWTGFSQFIDYFSNTPLRRHYFLWRENLEAIEGCTIGFTPDAKHISQLSTRKHGSIRFGVLVAAVTVVTTKTCVSQRRIACRNCNRNTSRKLTISTKHTQVWSFAFFCWPYRRHWNAGSNKLPSKMRKNRAPVCVSVQMELIPLSA